MYFDEIEIIKDKVPPKVLSYYTVDEYLKFIDGLISDLEEEKLEKDEERKRFLVLSDSKFLPYVNEHFSSEEIVKEKADLVGFSSHTISQMIEKLVLYKEYLISNPAIANDIVSKIPKTLDVPDRITPTSLDRDLEPRNFTK